MPKVKSAMTKRNPKARLMRAASFMLIAPVTKLVAALPKLAARYGKFDRYSGVGSGRYFHRRVDPSDGGLCA